MSRQGRSNVSANVASFYSIRKATSEFQIPVFADGLWHDFLPRETDNAGANLEDPETGSADRNLLDVAIDRHDKAVNVAFWDCHVETVKLPSLWTIKWSSTWTRTTSQKLPGM